ncbi:MAG: hypothetical protein ING44_00860 [Telmatospirillum sp.]|nr:hypothetical protein [Telmatospirillum sp.]
MHETPVPAADIAARFQAARDRFARTYPEPAAGPRLIDPLLRLFGKDSQSYARHERARALDRLARDAVLAELIGEGVGADAAREALDAFCQGARGR